MTLEVRDWPRRSRTFSVTIVPNQASERHVVAWHQITHPVLALELVRGEPVRDAERLVTIVGNNCVARGPRVPRRRRDAACPRIRADIIRDDERPERFFFFFFFFFLSVLAMPKLFILHIS